VHAFLKDLCQFLLFEMWKAGVDVKVSNTDADDDEWETDPDFVVRFFYFMKYVGSHS